jgi:hypothetical protein
VRIIIASAAIIITDALTAVFAAGFAADGLADVVLRATAAARGRVVLPALRRLALADAFFTDLRADFADFFLAPAADLDDRPAVFVDALLMEAI